MIERDSIFTNLNNHLFSSCSTVCKLLNKFIISVSVLNSLSACKSGSSPTYQILLIYCLILTYNSFSDSKCSPHESCRNMATAPSLELYGIIKCGSSTSFMAINSLLCV